MTRIPTLQNHLVFCNKLRKRHLGLLFFLCLISNMALAVSGHTGDYSLEIYKSDRLLLVKKNNLLQRSYKIAVGSGGRGHKSRDGDNITPVGVYQVVHFKENSRFHLFMQLNYPNSNDALRGLQRSVIQKYEFDRIIQQLKSHKVPDQRTSLGGSIGIHGIGNETKDRLTLHQIENWTQGCIAVTNEEIDELRTFVEIGTRVIIFH